MGVRVLHLSEIPTVAFTRMLSVGRGYYGPSDDRMPDSGSNSVGKGYKPPTLI